MTQILYLVAHPLEACFQLVRGCVNLITPFNVRSGISFQLHYSECEYYSVTKAQKVELLKHMHKADICKGDHYAEAKERQNQDGFWLHTKEYIFNYKCVHALTLLTNVEYGYEGINNYTKSVVFLQRGMYPTFIQSELCKQYDHIVER